MPAGRPLKFSSKKDLDTKIKSYFDSCWSVNSIGILSQTRPYTVTGLAVALDTSRQTLINYESRERFFDTIKKAKDKIENYNEEQLYRNTQVAGVIFNLKNNYDWKDKTELDAKIQGNISLTDLFNGSQEK